MARSEGTYQSSDQASALSAVLKEGQKELSDKLIYRKRILKEAQLLTERATY